LRATTTPLHALRARQRGLAAARLPNAALLQRLQRLVGLAPAKLKRR